MIQRVLMLVIASAVATPAATAEHPATLLQIFDERQTPIGFSNFAMAISSAGLFFSTDAVRAGQDPIRVNPLFDAEAHSWDITGNDPEDRLGQVIVAEGDWLATGDRASRVGLINCGAVHLFRREANAEGNPWRFHSKLTPELPAQRDDFGISLAIDLPYLVVGAPRAGSKGQGGGYITIFRLNGEPGHESWDRVITKFAAAVSPDDWFGHSVAIFERFIIVGAPNTSIPQAPNSGRAYLYEITPDGSECNEIARLESHSGLPYQWFGTTVAIDSDCILVASKEDCGENRHVGAVECFQFDRAVPSAKRRQVLTDPACGRTSQFGSRLQLKNGWLIAAAHGTRLDDGTEVGCVHIYKRSEEPDAPMFTYLDHLWGTKQPPYMLFGNTIAFDGSILYVGESSMTPEWPRPCRLFVYELK